MSRRCFQDYFDAIVCINLDHRGDRWAEMQGELLRFGITKCVRVSASVHPTNGTIGCAMSHRRIWELGRLGDLGDRFLVLEDDAQVVTHEELKRVSFSEDSAAMKIFRRAPCGRVEDEKKHPDRWLSNRFYKMIQGLPSDWDVLYLGGSYAFPPHGLVSENVIHNAGMHTTHAYAMTRRAVKQISCHLNSVSPSLDEHVGGIDSVLCGYAETMRFFTLCPRLFVQRMSRSDVNPNAGHHSFAWSQFDPIHEMELLWKSSG